MIGFNPDGSIKLPEKMAKKKTEEMQRMRTSRCMRIRKEIVSTKAPKACSLHMTISERITDNRFVKNIFDSFNQSCEVPCRFICISDREFQVDIGTSFRRCSDCTALVQRYRSFLEGNLIEQDGGCEYRQKRQQNFCYEDYFD